MCPWNDDAFMRTAGWDELVRSAEVEILHNEDNSGSGCFPFVHVGVFDILGRFTSHPAIDTWYTDIGWGAGICQRIPVLIHQERPDLGTADPDETWLEGRIAPLVDYYEEKGILQHVDGSHSPDEVEEHIHSVLATLRREDEEGM